MNNLIPIEAVINIYDPSIMWCNLAPQYPGYQLSNTGIIRSMKFYKKYPYGTLLKPKNGVYSLSNSVNQVEQVSIDALRKTYNRYIINTMTTDIYSRNPIITSKSTHKKKKLDYKAELNKPSGFHFKTID